MSDVNAKLNKLTRANEVASAPAELQKQSDGREKKQRATNSEVMGQMRTQNKNDSITKPKRSKHPIGNSPLKK